MAVERNKNISHSREVVNLLTKSWSSFDLNVAGILWSKQHFWSDEILRNTTLWAQICWWNFFNQLRICLLYFFPMRGVEDMKMCHMYECMQICLFFSRDISSPRYSRFQSFSKLREVNGHGRRIIIRLSSSQGQQSIQSCLLVVFENWITPYLVF